jgi:hypothetical protein
MVDCLLSPLLHVVRWAALGSRRTYSLVPGLILREGFRQRRHEEAYRKSRPFTLSVFDPQTRDVDIARLAPELRASHMLRTLETLD